MYGDGTFRVGVVAGDDHVASILGERDDAAATEATVERVRPERVDEDRAPPSVDCLLIDGGTAAGGALATAASEAWPSLPVVVLVAMEDTAAARSAAEALSAGVAETLPRRVAATAPGVVWERLITISEREGTYEQVFQMAGDGIVIHDPETGEVVDANERVAELLGYDREALLDEPMGTFFATDRGYTAERAGERIRESFAAGGPERVEWALETADGEPVWIEARHEVGEIGGEKRVVAIIRDVTERRRQQDALEEEREKYSTIVEQSSDGIVVVQEGTYSFVNERFAAITGYEREALVGRPFDEVFTPAYRELVRERYRQRVAGEEPPSRYDVEIETADGEVRTLDLSVSQIRHEGEPATLATFRDITERKARERRIASFTEATDDLTTADTPAAAARRAVEAATETLELSVVGAFLYDEATGRLAPEVCSPAVPDDAGAVTPGDGPLWDAFADGTTVAPDRVVGDGGSTAGTEADDAVITALADWRGLALGSHGVLLVGAREGRLDPDTVQAAHVLAATLEAALNHLRGRERLASREEELRTQTERAERLDRIARLAQRVEAAITAASDPGEVERAVAERLAGTGPYEAAWIGGVDVGADRLTPRAVVGADRAYVDGMELSTTGTGADRHPAVRAWRDDAVHVAASLVEGGPAGEWRRRALGAGHQSLCAVPLAYDGVAHGVLTVAADAPNAFGDRERGLLEQLGRSVGYALTAIERRRALEADETVELEFEGAGTDLRFARTARGTDCRVDHERTVPRDEGGVSVYFRLVGDPPADAAAVAERTLPGAVSVVESTGEELLVEARTDSWFGSPLAGAGAVLREATATPEGATVLVELPAGAAVRSFVDRLEGLAPSLDLVAKRQHQRRDRTTGEVAAQLEERLTDRQQEALREALTAGYFEWPRESDGNEVADRLDITQPTLNKHLRLAEQKTFELLLED